MALSAGCSTSAPSATSSATAPRVTLQPDASTIACGMTAMPDGRLEPEVYMLSAMNNKLRVYPEFAAALGMSSVSSCESARAFMSGYVDYLARFPDFDANQPLAALPSGSVSLPAGASGSYQVKKILNGDPAVQINQVVRLEFMTSNNGPVDCTGTFIAKNWILTAAHCISPAAIDPCVQAGIPITVGQCVPQWREYSLWSAFGAAFQVTNAWALAYVHPDWPGRDPSQNSEFGQLTPAQQTANARFDLALLYLGDDRMLPPDVEQDGAMRLSLSNPVATTPYTFYGAGAPNDTLLQSRDNGELAFHVNADTIDATVLDTTASALCPGDSGGPLTRVVNVQTNTGTRDVKAIVAVANFGLGACISTEAGESLVWTRIDNQLDFIEEAQQHWNGPDFQCVKRSSTSDALDEIAECWGDPCSMNSDCTGPSQYCSRAGEDFMTCSVCPQGGCDCIKGQCLTGPSLDGGTDGGTDGGP
jgi:hypothetical protein